MINRLIEPTTGRIFLDGADVTDADPVQLRRGIGYVIQQIGLFPHQKIATNVTTVPLLLGESKARRPRPGAASCSTWSASTPTTYADRYPHQLSGGQQQRVGVARALAADPPVLLMDEPFGAVDPVVRARLQDEFLRLQRELGKTVVLVTHDIDEAVKMGDRVAVFAAGGRLAQYDDPGRAPRRTRPTTSSPTSSARTPRPAPAHASPRSTAAHLEPMDGVTAAALAGTVDASATLEEALALRCARTRRWSASRTARSSSASSRPNGIHRMLRASVAEPAGKAE